MTIKNYWEKIKHWGTSRNTHQHSCAKGWGSSLFPSLRNISHGRPLLKMREGSGSVYYPESRTFSNSQHYSWKVYFLEEDGSKKHLNSPGCFLFFYLKQTPPFQMQQWFQLFEHVTRDLLRHLKGLSCFSVWSTFIWSPGSSGGKESDCNSGDCGVIPGSRSSPGEGTGYLLQYSWASLVLSW